VGGGGQGNKNSGLGREKGRRKAGALKKPSPAVASRLLSGIGTPPGKGGGGGAGPQKGDVFYGAGGAGRGEVFQRRGPVSQKTSKSRISPTGPGTLGKRAGPGPGGLTGPAKTKGLFFRFSAEKNKAKKLFSWAGGYAVGGAGGGGGPGQPRTKKKNKTKNCPGLFGPGAKFAPAETILPFRPRLTGFFLRAPRPPQAKKTKGGGGGGNPAMVRAIKQQRALGWFTGLWFFLTRRQIWERRGGNNPIFLFYFFERPPHFCSPGDGPHSGRGNGKGGGPGGGGPAQKKKK